MIQIIGSSDVQFTDKVFFLFLRSWTSVVEILKFLLRVECLKILEVQFLSKRFEVGVWIETNQIKMSRRNDDLKMFEECLFWCHSKGLTYHFVRLLTSISIVGYTFIKRVDIHRDLRYLIHSKKYDQFNSYVQI